ncbi:MAG: hypothetical protein GX851_01570 [Clostridiales bacterium]|nr:hypothetical protein [Clostridiales bacterium]
MALDMKSLKSKLGGAGGSTDEPGGSAEKKPGQIMDFFDKNPAMKIAVPVLLVVLVVGVIALILLKTGGGGEATTTGGAVPPGGSVVVVLPQDADLEAQETMPTGDARDPFIESNYLSEAKVTAIIAGRSANIVLNGGTSITCHLNDYIQSSSWQVVSITSDTVTIERKVTVTSNDTTSVAGEEPTTSQETKQIVLKLAD